VLRIGAREGSAILKLPLNVPGLSYRMLWHERDHDDFGVIWLRDLVVNVANHKAHPFSI
jgi:hypothetical protein